MQWHQIEKEATEFIADGWEEYSSGIVFFSAVLFLLVLGWTIWNCYSQSRQKQNESTTSNPVCDSQISCVKYIPTKSNEDQEPTIDMEKSHGSRFNPDELEERFQLLAEKIQKKSKIQLSKQASLQDKFEVIEISIEPKSQADTGYDEYQEKIANEIIQQELEMLNQKKQKKSNRRIDREKK